MYIINLFSSFVDLYQDTPVIFPSPMASKSMYIAQRLDRRLCERKEYLKFRLSYKRRVRQRGALKLPLI
jgi:hypothetical protein